MKEKKIKSVITKEDVLNVLELLDTSVVIFDKSDKLIYANKKAAELGDFASVNEMLTISQKELLGRDEIYDEEGNKLSIAAYPGRVAVKGVPLYNQILEKRSRVNGSHRWLKVTSIPQLDDKKEVTRVVSFIDDISDKKTNEEKLRFLVKSTKVLSITDDFKQRLIEKAKLTIPALADWCAIDLVLEDGELSRVAIAHRDPKKIEAVKEWSKRYPPKKNDPTGVHAVVKSGKAEFYPAITEEMIRQSVTDPVELKFIQLIQISAVMIIPIISRGKVLGALTTAYAESGRRYTEEDFMFLKEFCNHLGVLFDNARLYSEIKRQDQAKDIFLATLSHELRNPLAPIKISFELMKMKMGNKHGELQEEIAIIEHQFDHINKLLTDLLDVSRFMHSKISLERKNTELGALLTTTVKTNRSFVQNKSIDFSLSLPLESLVIDADPVRLEQAIMNILHNAEKFTPAGGKISVVLTKKDDTAVISISDNGMGIEKSDLPKIFEMYYQRQGETKRSGSGLGIGLLLVKEIVQLHGGTVVARSEGENKGSEFIITLPLNQKANKETNAGGKRSITIEREMHKMPLRVLVVDDNRDAANSLTRLLKEIVFAAQACYSGKEALAAVESFRPDLFILDLSMPIMDGYQLIKELREKGFANTPIIALTGHGLAEDRRKTTEAGFDYHMTKPIGIEDLKHVLNSSVYQMTDRK